MLLVVAPDLVVASWARQPIELGHPGFRLAPLVVDFSTIPRLDDASLAHRVPELAVLASLAHKISLGAQLALDAIGDLPEDRRALYCDVIALRLIREKTGSEDEPIEAAIRGERDLARLTSLVHDLGLAPDATSVRSVVAAFVTT